VNAMLLHTSQIAHVILHVTNIQAVHVILLLHAHAMNIHVDVTLLVIHSHEKGGNRYLSTIQSTSIITY